ncbi:response regulator transcription factor [Bacteriovoracales bacterium]|nr:response regulator transcription factor [Bacteriovoracales bacterium]
MTEDDLKGKKILIIEDEAHIAEGVAYNLRREGFEYKIATNGVEALELWKSYLPDLLILDLMLPMIDGFGVLDQVRNENKKIPILILSARNQTVDKMKGFQKGVDDYLTKPFELEEFLARVKRLLLRASWTSELSEENELGETYNFGPNTINFRENKAITPEKTFQLTEQEIKLLKLFFVNPQRALSREDLLNAGWGYKGNMETRTVDNFIVRLRKYFEKDNKNPRYFRSVRGKGYMFYP